VTGPATQIERVTLRHGAFAEEPPRDWDHGGLVRVEPATLLAWREMPTTTRWRFAGR
jgi:hypothetical protein